MFTLEVLPREKKEKLESLRAKGFIPAVFYGKKEASTPISVSSKDFLKVWKAAGESSVITLKGKEGDLEALIHEIDIDPVKGDVRHADFYVFEKGHKTTVHVPIEFVGEAPAVKELGAVLVKVLYELEVEAMPKDLPHDIKVDVSSLSAFGSQILVKDISVPQGVTLLANPEEVIVLANEPKEEKIEEEVAPDLSAIEVEKKGKEAKEGEEGAAEAPGATPAPEQK